MIDELIIEVDKLVNHIIKSMQPKIKEWFIDTAINEPPANN